MPFDEEMRAHYLTTDTAFLGEVTPDSARTLMVDLLNLSQKDHDHIPMVIRSNGGDTYVGFTLVDFIDYELRKPIHARIVGGCHSSGTHVLLCCEKRIARPHSRFIIHRQTTGLRLQYEDNFSKHLKGWAAEQQQLLETLAEFYAKKLRISKRKALQLMDRGSGPTNDALNADEALKIGLVTEIER